MIRKLITRIIIWLLAVTILLVAAVVGGTIALKDKLIQRGIQAINDELNAPVQVDGISFSLINTFPYASIVLSNVTVLSPAVGFNHAGFSHTTGDTLLHARKIALSFNIRELLNNQLELNSAKMSDGKVFLLVDRDGNDNFHIIKQKQTAAKQQKIDMQLKYIGFDNCAVQICNRFKKNGVEWYMPDFEANGKLDSSGYQCSTKGTLTLQWIDTDDITIVPLAPTHIRMDVNIRNDSIRVREGRLWTRGIDLALSGNVLMGTKTRVDLSIKGRKVEIADVLRYFTLATHERPAVESAGQVTFSALVRGRFDKCTTPLITAQFNLNNAIISYPKLKLKLANVNLDGNYSNGGAPHSRNSYININQLSMSIWQTSFSGHLHINNLTNPHINLAADVNGKAEEWNSLIFGSRSDKIAGNVRGTIRSTGTFNPHEPFSMKQLLNLNPEVEAHISGGSYTDGRLITLTDIEGKMRLNRQNLTITHTTADLNAIPLSFNGNLPNLLEAVVDPYPAMRITGTLQLYSPVDYSQIKPLFDGGNSTSKMSYNVDVQMIVSKFTYQQFSAERASCRLRYSGNNVSADALNFYTLGGRVNTQVLYRTDKNRKLSCKGSVSDIDISQLFSTFNNFGQTYITNSNIEGRLNATFKTSVPFEADTVDVNGIDFDGRLNIKNGKLHGIETIDNVADFTKIDEFRSLEFSTLSNDISITDGTITIPKMDIECNACDLSIYGIHKLSGDYEYHVTAVLSDFMRGKAKRLRQQNTPYGIVEDDAANRTSVYLLASRNNGRPSIKFDRPEMKQQFRQEVQQQKQEVKRILKKEFGLFKKDTTIDIEQPTPAPSPGFVIEWDEE